MFIAADQVIADLGLLANGGYLLLLLFALRHADWRRLWRPDQLNLYLVACLALIGLWSLRAGVSPGLALHYLGVTAFTLLFGWGLAIVGTSAALVGMLLLWGGDWGAFAINALVVGATPVLVTLGVHHLARRYLPAHFFIYLYINVFLAAALAILVSVLLVAALLTLSGAYSLPRMGYEYLAYLPLLVLPEAILNGMLMTAFVVLKPDVVATFDDDFYLKNR
ncbi:MAG: energy-coupling factor ABC transporter permease [Chromatiales bacterium]|nr:energy-coupling factor ABC transporter permease [Chromatiales bacterium]